MFVIISGCYSDWSIVGYVKTEEEAIQYTLDGETYYQEISKIKVGKEIMEKKRYTKVGVCFRTKDLINWTNTDIRKDYSDEPFKKVERDSYLNMGWIYLEHLSDGYIEKSLKIINDEFSFIKYELSKLENKSQMYIFLESQNINIRF